VQLLCFSHLRWGFVYQRPQHLLSRFAQQGAVHVWEEPVFRSCTAAELEVSTSAEGVRVVTPVLPVYATDEENVIEAQRALLDRYIVDCGLTDFITWYYTPMGLRFSDHLTPSVIVYDCMDELSAFDGAPPALVAEEKRLFERADVVFSGGASLYAAKRTQHHNVHLFPSSVDRAHFAAARAHPSDPDDQRRIPHPRIGFYGVLDERLDRNLLRDVAALQPEWHLVLLGPVVKIREDELPRADNLHYLGQKSYSELPSYLGNWEVAMLPFARNASTRFISPTKTPEYLAGGKPVVSTPIPDVVRPYGDMRLVRIGETAAEFADAIQQSLRESHAAWLEGVDAFLANSSWDDTFKGMWNEIRRCKQLEHSSRAMTYKAQEE
jgi:glycosyltransferase involved in cell wall biosynthesis